MEQNDKDITYVINKEKSKVEKERKGKYVAKKRYVVLHWKLAVKKKEGKMCQICR